MKKFLYLLLVIIIGNHYNILAQINITNSNTAATLVGKLVGTGVTYSNPTLTCSNNGAGYFVSTNAMLGIDSGVLLTTGYAKDAAGIVGVNNPASINAREDRGFIAGDIDLYNLASIYNPLLNPSDIFDVCKLEFDFVPQGDTIRFNYKFGSEEYPDYVCSNFNDYFAFFISGTPGYPVATNLAKIPGTNIPVTINSINSGTAGSGWPFSNCTGMGFGSPFTNLFQNTSTSTSVVYNGFTKLLESKTNVTPCSTYHMKFLVADILDGDFDSGVFLKSGSFKSDIVFFDSIHSPTALPINWPYSTEGCNSDTIYVKRPKPKPFAQTIFVTVGGTATNGVDYITIPSTLIIPANDTIVKLVITPILDALVEGTETLTIGLKTTTCNTIFSDTMTVLINEFPYYTVTDNDSICIGQPKSLVATLASPNTDIKFKWMPGNINAPSFNTTPLSSGIYTLTATYPGCPTRDSLVNITVAQYPIINAGLDTNICIGNSYTINATGSGTAQFPPIYTWTPAGTLSSSNTLTTIATPTASTTYILSATNSVGCTVSDAISISAKPSFTLSSAITAVNCANANGGLLITNSINAANTTYVLMPNNISNTTGIFTGLTGNTNYTITASNANYCTTTAIINLPGVIPVLFTTFVINDITCNGANNGNLQSVSSGNGTITYQLLPNNITNTSGTFTNLQQGTYTISATDAQNCSTLSTFTITEPSVIVINNFSATPINCNGGNNGTITANATGGTGVLQYILAPNMVTNNTGLFTSLSAGTYILTVKDNKNCTALDTIQIAQPAGIIIDSVTTQLANCSPLNSGSATIYTTGGTGIVTYSAISNAGNFTSANNVFTNLIPNTYTLIATDANNCSKTIVTTISQVIAPMFIGISNTQPSCFGGNNGTISTTIINANTTINYTILPSITNNANGTFSNATIGNYTVTLADAFGCTNSISTTITQPTNVIITSTTSTPTLCNNTPTGTIQVIANGGTGILNYLLINTGTTNTTGSFTGLGASTYTIQISDANNCSKTTITQVTQPSTLSWNNITQTNVSCFNGSNGSISGNAIGGTNTITYYLNNAINNPPYNNLVATNYTIVASDINGCSISTVVVITQPNLLQFTAASQTALSCVPGNDATLSTTISGGTANYTYTINGGNTNATGMYTNNGAGSYNIQVTDSKGCTAQTSITIAPPILPIFASINFNNVGCSPSNNSTIQVNMINPIPSYMYSIGGSFQSSNVFNNQSANTYIITVKDSLQCIAKDTIVVGTLPAPSITSITKTAASCIPGCDGSITVTATSAAGGALTYLVNNANPNTNNIINNLCVNNYTISVTDFTGCIVTSVVNIIEQSKPIFTNSITNNITCNGLGNGKIYTTVTNGNPAYTYTLNNNSIASADSITNLQSGNYIIIVTDLFGCKDTTTANILQPSALQLVVDSTKTPLCFNANNGKIYVTASGGTGTLQYSINNNLPQTNGAFTGLSGNTTYTITIKDANSCTTTLVQYLGQPSALQFASINTDSVNCWNVNNGAIYATANGGTGLITYTINPNNITNTTGQFLNLLGNTYTLTIKDANNCSTNSTVIVGQPQPLSFNSLSNIAVSCKNNQNGSITASGVGGIGAYTFTNVNASTTNTSGNFTGLAGANYTIQITDAANCTRTSVTILAEPDSLLFTTIIKSNVVCNGSNTGSIGCVATNGNSGKTYSILPALAANNSTGSFINLPINTYTITCIDSKGCSTTISTTITQPAALAPTVSNIINTSCSNASNGQISSAASGGVSPYSFTTNGTTNTSGVFSGLFGGNYIVTVTDANLCTATINATINTPNAIAIDSLQTNNIICFGDTNGALQIFASGGTGNLNYLLQPNSLQNTTGIFTNLLANNYLLTITDGNGCTYSSNTPITQNSKLNISNILVINPICNGGTEGVIKLIASGGLAPLQYSFNNSAFSNNNSYTNLTLGTYTIKVIDNGGCTIDTTITLNTPQKLIVTIDSVQNQTCINSKNGTIYAKASFGNPGGYTYLIIPTNNVNTIGTFTGLTPATYTIIARDNLGCEGSTTTAVNYNADSIDVDFAITPITCAGFAKDGIVQAIPTGGTQPYSYSWNALPDTSATIDSLVTGYYYVTVTDAAGCSQTSSVHLLPSNCCEVFIPNAFTPNGDRLNDELIPLTSASIQLLQYDVYDRFGNHVFNTIQANKGWDGFYKGQAMDMDTYFYIYQYRCLYNNEVIKKMGDVILTR